MGSTFSRNKQPQGQWPPGYPPQPMGWGQVPQWGGPSFPQPSFYPPFGQQEQPRRRKRRSRSRSEEIYPGGYQQTRSMDVPRVTSFAASAAQSQPAPRRHQPTPYPGRVRSLAAESDMGPPPQVTHVQATVIPPSNAGVDADISRILQPMTPANPGVYGPADRNMPRSPLTNPLPPPPRDLYELSPYKSLLNLPQTTALLTAAYSNQMSVGAGVKRSKTGIFGGNGKKSGGLFRSFSSSTRKHESTKPDVHFVPVFLERGASTSTTSQPTVGVAPPMPEPTPQVFRSQPPMQAWGGNPPQTAQPPMPGSIPGQMPIIHPVIFTQFSEDYQGFLNHSPYRVLYQNQTYPTATHLYEALKFIPESNSPSIPRNWIPRPDLASSIRNTKNPSDVYAQSANYRQFERPDWGLVFLRIMEEVLLTKFKQHPNLRHLLMSTAPAELIYRDPDDLFWSDGRGIDEPPDGIPGPGENQLGKALMKVRDRLRTEGNPY